jgi:hypothetical protein
MATLKLLREELPESRALFGSAEKVSRALHNWPAASTQVIAFALDPEHRAADAKVLSTAVDSLLKAFSKVRGQQHQAIDALIDAMVVPAPPPVHVIAQARMKADAINAVFADGDWLTAGQLSDAAGFSATNPSAQPNKWKKAGQIFAVLHKGVDRFPAYALDADNEYRPLPVIAEVLRVLGGKKTPVNLAIWFSSANSFLGGARPKDLLKDQPDLVIGAAKDEVLGIRHG